MKLLRVLLALLALTATARAVPLTDYVVKPGDSCRGIAKAVYGDPNLFTLIHRHNKLGPEPHNLVPGTVLHLPPKEDVQDLPIPETPPAAKAAPDATLTSVRNRVDKFTPEKGRGTQNDPLKRGDRVYTEDSSSAEVTFQDDSRLQLGETTLVVILGDSSGRVVKGAGADDTTLVSGSLRAHLGELVGRKPRTFATEAGSITVSSGEAQVHVDKEHTTRLAVYAGTSSLTAQRQRVTVSAGYGTKAEKGQPPKPPHTLPPAPVWVNAPPPFLFAAGTAGFTATYGAGPGSAPAHWHLQVASDDRFNALKVDTRVDAAVTHLDARELEGGRWFVRVSAIDEDNFEGPFLTPAVVQVATADLAPGAPGKVRISLSAPGTLSCGLDDEPLTPRPAPFEIPARRAHALHCMLAGAPASPAEVGLPTTSLNVSARLTATGPGSGILTVTATDLAGRAIPGLELLARPHPPLTLGTFHESEGSPEGGSASVSYVADARWPADAHELTAELADAQGTIGSVSVEAPAAKPETLAAVMPESEPGIPAGTSLRLGFAWLWGLSSSPSIDLGIAQRVWGTPHLDINVDLDAVNSYFGNGGNALIGAGAEIDWFPHRTSTFAFGLGLQANYAFALYESDERHAYGNGGEFQGQIHLRWAVSPSWALGLRLHGGGYGASFVGWGGLLGLDFVVIRHAD